MSKALESAQSEASSSVESSRSSKSTSSTCSSVSPYFAEQRPRTNLNRKNQQSYQAATKPASDENPLTTTSVALVNLTRACKRVCNHVAKDARWNDVEWRKALWSVAEKNDSLGIRSTEGNTMKEKEHAPPASLIGDMRDMILDAVEALNVKRELARERRLAGCRRIVKRRHGLEDGGAVDDEELDHLSPHASRAGNHTEVKRSPANTAASAEENAKQRGQALEQIAACFSDVVQTRLRKASPPTQRSSNSKRTKHTQKVSKFDDPFCPAALRHQRSSVASSAWRALSRPRPDKTFRDRKALRATRLAARSAKGKTVDGPQPTAPPNIDVTNGSRWPIALAKPPHPGQSILTLLSTPPSNEQQLLSVLLEDGPQSEATQTSVIDTRPKTEAVGAPG